MIAFTLDSFCRPQRISAVCALLVLALATGCAGTAPQPEKRSFAFWPTYPDDPHILFLASYNRNTDLEPKSSGFDQMLYGTDAAKENYLVDHPYGVALWNGRIYVCDTHSPAVVILDLRKRQIFLMAATGNNAMRSPLAITVAEDGWKYVADNTAGTISVFDQNDAFVRQFGHKDFHPVGLAVFGNRLYAADYKASHVEIFDRTSGQSVGFMGSRGLKEGQMVGPLGVAVDAQGNVYVSEVLMDRVQKFSPDGKFLGKFGQVGDQPGTFTRPKHIAVDHDGIIYVVDNAFQNVQMFDQQFRPLMFFGSPGNHPGAMDMPAGITVHEGDLDIFKDRIPGAFEPLRLIVVTNQNGNRISVYAMGQLRAGHTVEELQASKNTVPEALTTSRPSMKQGGALPPSASTMPSGQ